MIAKNKKEYYTKNKQKILEWHRIYKQRKRGYQNTYQQNYRLTNPLKYAAHTAVQKAYKKGILIKPISCKCGSDNKIEFHHTQGYAEVNWLVGIFLCRECHDKEHTQCQQ